MIANVRAQFGMFGILECYGIFRDYKIRIILKCHRFRCILRVVQSARDGPTIWD